MLTLCLSWLAIVAPAAVGQSMGRPDAPLPRAHAHNDYEHARPLFDALAHGFASVEADVWLVGGRLLVAHDREAVRVDRTLESLYLDPLRERVAAPGGRLGGAGAPFLLWIDVKSEAEPTYAALRDVLARYDGMLTTFRTDGVTEGAVTVVISGNRARETLSGETLRFAAIDGRLADLETSPPASLVPVISDNWQNVFAWRGAGVMPDDEREKLRAIVARAHGQGRKIRFWAIPDTPAGWQVCLDAGVDLINTDDLPGLQAFLMRPASND
ncbi:MAG: phosphatidylinositol-specific phospholipase C/glycerophosphodiester phosphodiesterase family protein [Acidobacteria bacterium]|nr:phosphatidylinositol-specific phospholipase C/glycerophosphodiester phosphodiesterase family protein [Acidobacteriota bacterium]